MVRDLTLPAIRDGERCAARRARGPGLDERSTNGRRAFAPRVMAPQRVIGERIAVVQQKSIFNSAGRQRGETAGE
jgi:hypothetical protein